nr:hypothetical protein [Gammaproteobacteria bacterium]
PIYVGGAARLRAEVLPPKVRQIADFAPGRRASRLPNDDVIRTEKSNSDIDAFVEALSRGFCQLKRFNGEWDSLVII